MHRIVSFLLMLCVLGSGLSNSFAKEQASGLPLPTQMLSLTENFSYPLLKGVKFYPDDPYNLEFVFDSASKDIVTKEDTKRLVEYFVAGLTMPEQDLWVNLSPYEKDRVIPDHLADTALGRDMLAQDYILKQLSSSLTYPESQEGKDYWQKILEKTANRGQLPINSYNKIWIMTDKATIYDNGTEAFLAEASFKTMLEQDYKALQENRAIEDSAAALAMKESLLPLIENEVNHGRHFTVLRQIQHSLLLAMWFKRKFVNTFYKDFFNSAKSKGIDIDGRSEKEGIYEYYLEAFKEGVFDYERKERDIISDRLIKKHYFSGGISEKEAPKHLTLKYGKAEHESFMNKKFRSRVSIVPFSSSINADQNENPKEFSLLPGLRQVSLDTIVDKVVGAPVRVKGRVPDRDKYDYTHHMLQIWTDIEAIESIPAAVELIAQEFNKAGREDISSKLEEKPVSEFTMDKVEEAAIQPINKMIHLFFPFLKGREHLLFDSEQVYPFSWKELQNERIIFSLGHVDTRIKVILQDIAEVGSISKKDVPRYAEHAHKILAYLLKADDFTLTQYVNNMLVVYLQDRVIQLLVGDKAYNKYRQKNLVPELQKKNDAALEQVKNIYPKALKVNHEITDRFVALQVLAGVCFPQDKQGDLFRPTSEFTQIAGGQGESRHMAINDLDDLFKDIQNFSQGMDSTVEFFLDDVGEGVFDLLFIEGLLNMFPNLKIRIWVNRYPVENNFSLPELNRMFNTDYFERLKMFVNQGRCLLKVTNVPLVCPDPRFFTGESLNELENATAVVIKGASFFETNQFKNINTYYGFANYHKATMETTGAETGKGIFAHVPRGHKAYQYDKEAKRFITLSELRKERTSSGVMFEESLGGISLRESSLDDLVPYVSYGSDNFIYPDKGFEIKINDLWEFAQKKISER